MRRVLLKDRMISAAQFAARIFCGDCVVKPKGDDRHQRIPLGRLDTAQ
jgi:hypothetical protein